jgi:hypothetical protein
MTGQELSVRRVRVAVRRRRSYRDASHASIALSFLHAGARAAADHVDLHPQTRKPSRGKRRLPTSGLLFSVSACAADTEALRTRAAFDLQCSNDSWSLTELAGGAPGSNGAVYGVEGCEHRATYVQQDHPATA